MRTQKNTPSQHLHSVPPPAVDAVAAPDATSFEALAAEARRVAPADARPLAGDLSSMHARVHDAVAAVTAERAKLDAGRVPVRWGDIASLASLALAYGEAVSRVASLEQAPTATAPIWQEYWDTRAKLLGAAESLIAWKDIPAGPIPGLRRARRGGLAAHDIPRITGWFREHAAQLEGSSPVTEKHLTDADALCAKVLRARRSGVRPAPSSALVDARRTRDALGWMLRARYDHLRAVATWLWPRTLTAHVPGLAGSPRRAKPTPAAPPDVTPR